MKEKDEKKSFQSRRQTMARPISVKLSQIQGSMNDRRKRTFVVAAFLVFIIILIATGYMLYADMQTKSLRAALASNNTSIQNELKTFSARYKKAKDKSKEIQALAVALPTVNCGARLWHGPLEEVVDRCEARNKQVLLLKEKLGAVSDMVQYDIQLHTILATAVGVDNNTSSSWKARETAWRSAVSALKKIEQPPQVTKEHALLIKHAQGVADAWRIMQKADSEKKLSNFEAAKKQLAVSYESLRKTAAPFQLLFNKAQLETVDAIP